MAVKMWSGNRADDVQIGLTSGHTFIVPRNKEGVEVPQRFRREALSRGCLPVGMEPEEEEAQGFDRQAVIKSAINAMLESEEEGLFTGDGKPNLTKLSAKVGFTVERAERDRIWSTEFEKSEDDNDSKPSMLDVK
jgi:hypothetical protein